MSDHSLHLLTSAFLGLILLGYSLHIISELLNVYMRRNLRVDPLGTLDSKKRPAAEICGSRTTGQVGLVSSVAAVCECSQAKQEKPDMTLAGHEQSQNTLDRVGVEAETHRVLHTGGVLSAYGPAHLHMKSSDYVPSPEIQAALKKAFSDSYVRRPRVFLDPFYRASDSDVQARLAEFDAICRVKRESL